MMKKIDYLLDRVTMYRLVVYELVFLLLVAGGLGALGILPYAPQYLAFSTVLIFVVCLIANKAFAAAFDAPYNPESTWITALILALLITPPHGFLDAQYLPLAVWASAWAIGSKFLLAIRKKHLFNPAALGVAMTALILGLSGSWWIGTPAMAPFVLLGGLLIVRKIRRFDLWLSFMGVFSAGILFRLIDGGGSILQVLNQSFLYAPVFFLGTVMLTEPMTTPPTKWLRIIYGALVGFLFLPNVSIGSFYFTPELALLAGNIFAYVVSPKQKLLLRLKETIQLSADVFEFVFVPERRLAFTAGQYMEWTLPHRRADNRGVRRYFTVASSPSDPDLRLGVKMYAPASTYKKQLLAMKLGDIIVAAQLAGDFTLPRNKKKKLVFIAGGIGITPFRSMLEELLAHGEKRSITVFYAVKMPADAVYRELLERVERELGIKAVYAFSDPSVASPVRRITMDIIAQQLPDYRDHTYYISGPQAMVTSFKETLTAAGVGRRAIKTDYFPGFA